MVFWKRYSSIEGYLERFTVLKIGRLHVRFHKIISEDKTPFFHNHPFNYLSIVLKGGYTEEMMDNGVVEEKNFGVLSFIPRSKKTYHRIKSVKPNTVTLFFAFGNGNDWRLKNLGEHSLRPIDGIYKRIINKTETFSKCVDGMFYIGHLNIEDCKKETRLSIHQDNFGKIVTI